MSEEEKLQLENECLMKYSKAQMIQKYIDELEESSKLSELWCKSQQENKKYKEVIDKIMNLIKQYGKYDGKKCTRGFQMWSADFNKILDMLKEVSE